MTKEQVRSIVGVILVLGQASVIGYVLFKIKDLFMPAEAFEVISLIAPLFSVYVISVTKNFVSKQPKRTKDSAGFNYTFINLFYPLVFVTGLLLTIKLYDTQVIASFFDLKKSIGIIETSFGIYLGIVIDSIFPSKAK